MPQAPHVVVAPERHKQLLDLRDALGLQSVSALMRELIATFCQVNKLERIIPGIGITPTSSGVSLSFEDRVAGGLSIEGTQALSDALRAYLADTKPRRTTLFNVAHGFSVSGYGRAVRIKFTESGVARQMAPDVAEELAQILEEKAASAKQTA